MKYEFPSSSVVVTYDILSRLDRPYRVYGFRRAGERPLLYSSDDWLWAVEQGVQAANKIECQLYITTAAVNHVLDEEQDNGDD